MTNTGEDPHEAGSGAINFARSDDPVVDNDSEIGADSPALTQAFSLAIVGGNGTDSGLMTTEGQPIRLFLENGIVVGRVDGSRMWRRSRSISARMVMSAWRSTCRSSMTTSTTTTRTTTTGGTQATTQGHNENPNPIQQTLDGKINAILTVTDSDGDTDTDTVGIGSKIVFEDDGPSVDVSTSRHDEIIHDETSGTQDDDVAGPLSVFAGVTNPGDDPHVAANPIGFAQGSDGFLDVDADFGSDGPGGVAFALRLSSNGTDSGLDTTEGRDIKLFLENGIVVGRYDGQRRQQVSTATTRPRSRSTSIRRPARSRSSSTSRSSTAMTTVPTILKTIADNKVFVDVKVTDGDGDYATDSVDLGKKIGFDDDGPTLTLGSNAGFSLVHDESAGLQDNDNAGALPSVFNGLASQYNNDPHALPNAPPMVRSASRRPLFRPSLPRSSTMAPMARARRRSATRSIWRFPTGLRLACSSTTRTESRARSSCSRRTA